MQPGTIRYRLLEDAGQAAVFGGMTYRTFLPLLIGLSDRGPGVAVGAWRANGDAEIPVGLALADLKSLSEPTQVVSLFVAAEARRQGIAGELLVRLAQVLQDRGVQEIFAVYPSGKEATPFLERLFAKHGWSSPRPRMYLFQASRKSLEKLLTAPWLRPVELPPEYSFFPWFEYTRDDYRALIEGLESGRIPRMLSPFAEEDQVEPAVSIGLRYRGEVFGWMVGHRIAEHMIRYTSLFVREDIPYKGLGFRLFTESLQRHIALLRDHPDAMGCWGVLASNPFAAFLQRRLMPYLPDAAVSLTHESRKLLGSVSAGT